MKLVGKDALNSKRNYSILIFGQIKSCFSLRIKLQSFPKSKNQSFCLMLFLICLDFKNKTKLLTFSNPSISQLKTLKNQKIIMSTSSVSITQSKFYSKIIKVILTLSIIFSPSTVQSICCISCHKKC